MVVFFSNVRPSLKLFLKRVESVLSGRSAALQRRLIVLPWNSHLIVPLRKTPWIRRQQAPLLLSRACLDKWFHNSFIPHLPYELIVSQGCMESVNVVSNVTIVCYFQDMSNNCSSEGCLLLQAPAAFLCHVQVVINQLLHVQQALWSPHGKNGLVFLHWGQINHCYFTNLRGYP